MSIIDWDEAFELTEEKFDPYSKRTPSYNFNRNAAKWWGSLLVNWRGFIKEYIGIIQRKMIRA